MTTIFEINSFVTAHPAYGGDLAIELDEACVVGLSRRKTGGVSNTWAQAVSETAEILQ